MLLLDLPSAIPDRYKPFYVGEHPILSSGLEHSVIVKTVFLAPFWSLLTSTASCALIHSPVCDVSKACALSSAHLGIYIWLELLKNYMTRTRLLAGFDAQWDTVPQNAVGIHHPHGNAKKISFVNGT